MSALEEDEQAQKMGCVFVSYGIGSGNMSSRNVESLRNVPVVSEAVPLRLSGVHYCYDNPQLRPIALLIQHAMGKDSRLRFRAHYGT